MSFALFRILLLFQWLADYSSVWTCSAADTVPEEVLEKTSWMVVMTMLMCDGRKTYDVYRIHNSAVTAMVSGKVVKEQKL